MLYMCSTDGCPNEGVQRAIDGDQLPGDDFSRVCGPCGHAMDVLLDDGTWASDPYVRPGMSPIDQLAGDDGESAAEPAPKATKRK